MRANWHHDSVLGCHLWDGGTNSKGYPIAWHDGRVCLVRRVAWEQKHGPLDRAVVLRSSCKRPLCVNPAHMTPTPHAVAVRLPRKRRSRPRVARSVARDA